MTTSIDEALTLSASPPKTQCSRHLSHTSTCPNPAIAILDFGVIRTPVCALHINELRKTLNEFHIDFGESELSCPECEWAMVECVCLLNKVLGK